MLMNFDRFHIWRDEKMTSTKMERHYEFETSQITYETCDGTAAWVMTFSFCI